MGTVVRVAGSGGRRAPLWVRVVVVPLATVVVLAVGAWVVSGRLGVADRRTQVLLAAGWFVAMSVVLGRVGKARPDLRWPLKASVWGTSALAALGFYWTSVRDTVVNEDVATVSAPPAGRAAGATARGPRVTPARPLRRAPVNTLVASGGIVGLDGHDGAGSAKVIRLASGMRVITLTDLDVGPGPDILVYLTPDQTTTGGDIVDLGRLKGTQGNQQYEIPGDADLGRHDTLVLWCRAFSVRVAAADLSPA